MLNVTLLTSVAKSALVGAVVTKIVDTLISSKINNKIEQNKWIRNTKLELFSKLTEDILSTDSTNISIQLREIKKHQQKIVLLINDRKLSDKIENYTNVLMKFNENERVEKNALSLVNKDMISFLSRNIKL